MFKQKNQTSQGGNMSKIKEEAENVETQKNDESIKKFLLTDESFKILTSAQSKIKDVTETTPTLRKLLNELVTQEYVDKLTDKFIKKLS